MPFNGTGTFSRIYSWAADAANNLAISASRMDSELNGIAAALTNCLTRDGQSVPSNDLPMGGKRITGLGAAQAGTDAVSMNSGDARYFLKAGGLLGGSLAVPTPDAGGGGGYQLRGNATSVHAVFQVTNSDASQQWGIWQYDPDGTATWSGPLKVGSYTVLHSGNFTAANFAPVAGVTGSWAVGGALSVTGNIGCTGWLDVATPGGGTTGGVRIRSTQANDYAYQQITNKDVSAQWGYLRWDPTGVMYWTGDFTAAGTIGQSSDARLKTNVRTIEGALGLVKQMRGVRFDKDGKARVGVIAQEMRDVVPEVVLEGADGFLTVDYGVLVGVLIEAIKELAP